MLTRFLVGDYVSSDGLREPVVIRVRHGSQLECPADPLSVVGVKQTLCTSCDFACAASAPSEAVGSAARVSGRGPEDNDLAGWEGEARWGWRSMVPTARPRYAHSWYAHAQSQCCRGSPRHVDFPPPSASPCARATTSWRGKLPRTMDSGDPRSESQGLFRSLNPWTYTCLGSRGTGQGTLSLQEEDFVYLSLGTRKSDGLHYFWLRYFRMNSLSISCPNQYLRSEDFSVEI